VDEAVAVMPHRPTGNIDATERTISGKQPIEVECNDEEDLDWDEESDDVSPVEINRSSIRRKQAKSWFSRADHQSPLFLRVPDHILARPELSANAKLLLAYLNNVDRKEGKRNVAPYQATLAEFLHVSPRQVRRYLEDCEETFLVTVEKRGQARSSKLYLHDSWTLNIEWKDDLILPWQAKSVDWSNPSPDSRARGQFRPKGRDRSVHAQDASVRLNGRGSPHL
jgi:hypothetical protein